MSCPLCHDSLHVEYTSPLGSIEVESILPNGSSAFVPVSSSPMFSVHRATCPVCDGGTWNHDAEEMAKRHAVFEEGLKLGQVRLSDSIDERRREQIIEESHALLASNEWHRRLVDQSCN